MAKDGTTKSTPGPSKTAPAPKAPPGSNPGQTPGGGQRDVSTDPDPQPPPASNPNTSND